MLQELRSGQSLAVAQLYHFSNVRYHVYHLHLLVELQSVLRIIPETYRFADIECTAVRFLQSHQNLDERRLSGTVVSNDTHFLVTGKDIREVIQNLYIAEALAQMVGLENL